MRILAGVTKENRDDVMFDKILIYTYKSLHETRPTGIENYFPLIRKLFFKHDNNIPVVQRFLKVSINSLINLLFIYSYFLAEFLSENDNYYSPSDFWKRRQGWRVFKSLHFGLFEILLCAWILKITYFDFSSPQWRFCEKKCEEVRILEG